MGEEDSYFVEQRRKLAESLERAKHMSNTLDNRLVDQRQGWASWLLLKLCISGQSLLTIAQPLSEEEQKERSRTLDHSTFAAIARNMIETAVMFAYIVDVKVSDDEWKLRRLVLCRHDATTRYRMFKGMKNNEQCQGLKKQREELRREIHSNPVFKSLSKVRREKVDKGQELYINGLRAVLRTMEWDAGLFNALCFGLTERGKFSLFRSGSV